MFECPRCNTQLMGDELKCYKCKFKFKISLSKFKLRESFLQEYVKNRKINQDYILHHHKKLNNLANFFQKNKIKKQLDYLNLTNHEIEIIKIKITSDIYLDKLKSKSLEEEIKNTIYNYNGKYKKNGDKILLSLIYLNQLTDYPNFNKYFIDLLKKEGLNENMGFVIYFSVVNVIINGNIQLNQIDENLIFQISKRKKLLSKHLNQYYKLTGRNYFSNGSV